MNFYKLPFASDGWSKPAVGDSGAQACASLPTLGHDFPLSPATIDPVDP
jgi:hypothetical protein